MRRELMYAIVDVCGFGLFAGYGTGGWITGFRSRAEVPDAEPDVGAAGAPDGGAHKVELDESRFRGWPCWPGWF
jgi:hypothetical protein